MLTITALLTISAIAFYLYEGHLRGQDYQNALKNGQIIQD